MTAGAPDDVVWSQQECRRVQRLCARLTGDAEVAADLAQETMLEAWRHRDRLVDPGGASPWIDAIARNVCSRWRVAQARRAVGARAAQASEVLDDPLADELYQDELVALVERALALLTPQARVVLVSRYVDELGPGAIADRLGLTPDAVSMRLQRARARLRQLIETELADEPVVATWRARHGLGWRRTRLLCGECGRSTTYLRRDPWRHLVELKCDHCDADQPSAVYRMDNPQLRALLADVTRPSAVVGRMADWGHRYWSAALGSGVAECTRCAKAVSVQTYQRADRVGWRTAHGWHTTCPACGETLSTSVTGLVLQRPEVRRLRRAHPGTRIVGDWETRLDGRDVRVVGVRDERSGTGVDVVLDPAITAIAAVQVLPVR